MRNLIANDQAAVCRGMCEIQAGALHAANFSEAGSSEKLLSRLANRQTGLVVLDVE